jgi:hypothetical protein
MNASAEGVALIEPDSDNLRRRGKFRMGGPRVGEHLRHHTGVQRDMQWRLMDLCLCIAASDDEDYLRCADPGEFAVVDVVTKEKAWFEMPFGATPHNITALIESHFNVSAIRVGEKLWFV